MLFVFLSTLDGNEDIVNIVICKREAMKNLVDKTLKGLCGIVKTKWHLQNSKSLKGVVMAVL